MEAQGAPSNRHVTHIAQDGPDAALSRREKRKGWKKAKRSERRQQAAEKARQDEELRKQDPSFHLQQAKALENERLEHELQEKLWLEREKEAQEEADRKRQKAVEKSEAIVEDDDNTWDYVEEGPAEIIWEGNEIIVRKQKVKVPKTRREKLDSTEDDHPVSNPLLPESLYRNSHSLASNSLPSQNAAFEDHKKLVHSTPLSSNEHNPNFGTEQDKTHCPFHIKTGVCRFGVNCSRAHVIILVIPKWKLGTTFTFEAGKIKDRAHQCDEEVLQNYEEFFEDVHGEFLKYGEIVNFKVCRNESSHLRGNVYAQFQSVDSAVAAYNALNGRFYAGKQITCEFVVVIRWRAALCGEYMRSHHKVCSHGTACNFLHCFRNPCGLYDWADWDNAPPRSFLATGHRRRGDSIEATTFQDKYNHRHDGHSHRHHRDNFSPKRMRSHQTSGKHVSRERRYKSHYNDDSSCEESLSGDRDGFQKVRRRWSSDKRSTYKGHHNSTSSSEESLFVEREGLREDRRHRSSDRRSREMGLAIREDASTKQKEDSRKKRHKSRSQDRYKRRQHGGSHDVSRIRGVTGKRSVSQGDGRSRSHESSESVVSSELGTFCKVTRRSRQHTRNRCSSDERYKPRSRSTSYDSLEQSPEDEMGTKKRSRNSSNKCIR